MFNLIFVFNIIIAFLIIEFGLFTIGTMLFTVIIVHVFTNITVIFTLIVAVTKSFLILEPRKKPLLVLKDHSHGPRHHLDCVQLVQ